MAQAPARKPWFVVWTNGTAGGNQITQCKAMNELVERQAGNLVNTLINPTKEALKAQIIATLQEAAVHKGMVWCTNGVTKPLISAKEFVQLAKQHANTSRRSYFTIFIYNNDAEDNDDWKDELELDYYKTKTANHPQITLNCNRL